MAYDENKDKCLAEVGTIVLSPDEATYQAIHVRVMKYNNQAPKVQVCMEAMNYSGEKKFITAKMPRFVREDMDKLVPELGKLLAKAKKELIKHS
jgi:hypothetical protein